MTSLIKRLRFGQKGFTLIELLVVVAIIALLATFAVPKLFEAINKSKKAPGQADMQTISAALDRYYFDKDKYPVYDGTEPAKDVTGPLTDGYLKGATTFRNGYKQGYLYTTTTNGKGFVLIDLQGNLKKDDLITITCKAPAATAGQPDVDVLVRWKLPEADEAATLITPDVPSGTPASVQLMPDNTKIHTCAITATTSTTVTVADLIKNTSMMTN